MYTVKITQQKKREFESGVEAFHYANKSWPIKEPEDLDEREEKLKELLAGGGLEYTRGFITVSILKED
tara:strand:+ start:881 stop:1084 length:204 start_codon:yes stop_codon:yes gene_type:complete